VVLLLEAIFFGREGFKRKVYSGGSVCIEDDIELRGERAGKAGYAVSDIIDLSSGCRRWSGGEAASPHRLIPGPRKRVC